MRFATIRANTWSSTSRTRVLIIDEIGFLKKVENSVGVARQYTNVGSSQAA
jgi:SRSO17 transposase